MKAVVKPAVKALWVDALRSGKYKQIYCSLYRKDKPGCHCAMGVLHKVAAEALGIDDVVVEDEVLRDFAFEPTDWKIDTIWGPVINGWSVASINDSGLPFPQIADLIESYL